METMSVLIVEDDAFIGMLLVQVLEQMGFTVCAVEATEAAAVTAALHHKPGLMIVDSQLREGSGILAVDKICRSRFIPHVFVSGDVEAVLAQRPGSVVLQKPFREKDLASAIERAFKASSLGECGKTGEM